MTVFNSEDYNVKVENVEADIQQTNNRFIIKFELSKGDLLAIFEGGQTCKIFDGKIVSCELMDKPVAVGGDTYIVKLITVQ